MMRHLPPTSTPIPLGVLWSSFAFRPSDLDAYRAALQQYLAAPYSFTAASGRTALYVLLDMLRQEHDQQRSEVVLPAYTCPSVAKVVLDATLSPRLVDISPSTFSYNMDELALAVSERTLAVLVVHPFGIPLPVQAPLDLAHAQGAVVIQDAAQALGARLSNRHIGIFGDFGLYSFGPGKPMSTGGGGLVVTSRTDAADRLQYAFARLKTSSVAHSALAALRLSVIHAAFHPTAWWLANRVGVQRVGEREASWSYSLRSLTPAQATAGLALLPQLDVINQARRTRGEQLASRLAGVQQVHVAEDAQPIYLRFPILFERYEARERAIDELNRAGIGAGRMYQKSLAEYFPACADGIYPGAESIARRLLTLPTHHNVSDADVEKMIAIVNRISSS